VNAGKPREWQVYDLSLDQGGCDGYNRLGSIVKIPRTRYHEFINALLLNIYAIMSIGPVNRMAVITARISILDFSP
jgi:hypothetical protein